MWIASRRRPETKCQKNPSFASRTTTSLSYLKKLLRKKWKTGYEVISCILSTPGMARATAGAVFENAPEVFI